MPWYVRLRLQGYHGLPRIFTRPTKAGAPKARPPPAVRLAPSSPLQSSMSPVSLRTDPGQKYPIISPRIMLASTTLDLYQLPAPPAGFRATPIVHVQLPLKIISIHGGHGVSLLCATDTMSSSWNAANPVRVCATAAITLRIFIPPLRFMHAFRALTLPLAPRART